LIVERGEAHDSSTIRHKDTWKQKHSCRFSVSLIIWKLHSIMVWSIRSTVKIDLSPHHGDHAWKTNIFVIILCLASWKSKVKYRCYTSIFLSFWSSFWLETISKISH
jgi:hypothetical protein